MDRCRRHAGRGCAQCTCRRSPTACHSCPRACACGYVAQQQQETQGPERAALAQLLQQHGVVVRGGQDEALRLLDALQVSQPGAGASSAGAGGWAAVLGCRVGPGWPSPGGAWGSWREAS